MSSFFEDLGRKLGRAAVPAYRKSKWVWDGLTGTEEEAIEAERDLGKTLAAELAATIESINDPEMLSWLREVSGQLEKAVDQPGFHYRCELIQSEHPTAIGLPGGYLFVSQSLIDFCEKNRGEMAFVIAHEMAHVVRRHTWDRMIQQSALRAASFATRTAGVLGNWMRTQGLPMLRGAHSRDSEFQADEDAVGLMKAAGFDLNEAVTFLKRIEQMGPDPEVMGEYLASHPPPAERTERIHQD